MMFLISYFIIYVGLIQFFVGTIECHSTLRSQRMEKQVQAKIRLLSDWEYSYSCPNTPGASIKVPSRTIRLQNAVDGKLCTLTLVNDEIERVPVGRSYNSNDWERVAGPYSSLTYSCYEDSYCVVSLPNTLSSNQEYRLTSYESSLPKRDEVARFLEQSTFGTTEADLNMLTEDIDESTELMPKFVDWVKTQIFELKATSHRAYYRKIVTSLYQKPGREGRQSRPCEIGSRWRWHSFTRHDFGKYILIDKVDNSFVLKVEGKSRTSVNQIIFKGNTTFKYRKLEEFKICSVQGEIFGNFGVLYNGKCELFDSGNPPISLIGINPEAKYMLDLDLAKSVMKKYDDDNVDIMVRKKRIISSSCSSLPYPLDNNVYGKVSNGQYLIFEPTLRLDKNKIKSPLSDGGGETVEVTGGVAQCANVPRTFLNEKKCKLSKKVDTCAPYGDLDGTLHLNDATIIKFYKLLQRPIYAIVDLRIEDDHTILSPCTVGERSRWRKIDDCIENVKLSTSSLFGSLMIKDKNRNFKDVTLQDDGSRCHFKDVEKLKLVVKVNGQCWINTHPDNFSIYDFKNWAAKHPGNTPSQNFIELPATQGHHKLQFPRIHPLSHWANNKGTLKYIGKIGDIVSIEDIPIWQLRNREVAEKFGLYIPKPGGLNTLVCGSPNEVANDSMSVQMLDVSRGIGYDALTDSEFANQKKTVWTMIALNAKDQLRQRMAWVLSQLLVISPSAILPHNTETFLVYYDIFVRNAFGNYRDVLREVAYSPMMARMLTYHESKSSEYMWKKYGSIQFADENFAREIMQLFSVGLVKLNLDGTLDRDEAGNPVDSYTNDDITEYARVWTGFIQQGPRGNIEEREAGNNSIDPMKIDIRWRDHYPKMGLDGKYIGDGYPLCSDLPQKNFLQAGAKWKLLGRSKNSDDQKLFRNNEAGDNVLVSVLDPSSSLFKKLCKSTSGQCTFPSVVDIIHDLPCTGIECTTGIKIAQLQIEDLTVNYEFIQSACVNFPFFVNGIKISSSRQDSRAEQVCSDRGLSVAAEACCDEDSFATHNTCTYTGERIPFPTAVSRCSKVGKDLCEYKSVSSIECSFCCNYNGFFWTNTSCEVVLIVNEDGKVAIERPSESIDFNFYDSLTFFRVHWAGGAYPNPREFCNESQCELVGQYCRCRIDVENNRVFDSSPSREAALSRLHIGGPNPSSSDYTSEEADDITIHVLHSKSNEPHGMDTIYEVVDNFGRRVYLKNMKSEITIGSFSFRNTPTFYNAVPELRDAQHETEAAIDHYFYHDNTAPFLALRFIQRFGISNPSPGFIERVARTFKTGTLDLLSIRGRYGDLGAVVSAIITDKESRDILLDSDFSYGTLREPLLKVIALMRGLGFKQTDGKLTSLDNDLHAAIGQESHEMPNIFSFFLPEYRPSGEIASSSLVAPEAMLLPYSLGTIDGMISLIKYGATQCFGGFSREWCTRKIRKGKNKAAGILRSSPSVPEDQIVDDLATLLTSGRMNVANRQIIRDSYFSEKNNAKKSKALIVAQQLAIASPEFHVTGKSDTIGTARKVLPARVKTCEKHKALVHIFLKGGCDSFNLLVPHSECNGTDLNRQYRKARGGLAIPRRDLLEIDATSSSQQCTRFGIHPKLPLLQTLYNQKDALFLAGIGVLSSPMTKEDFKLKTKTQLFAHNKMQAEINRLDPYGYSIGTGILGRLSDALNSQSYSVNSFSIDASLFALQGDHSDEVIKTAVNSKRGFKHFNPSDPTGNVSQTIPLLNGNDGENNGILSRFWSSSLHNSIQTNNELYWAQRKGRLNTQFPTSELGRQLELVSKLLKSNECRGADRDVFYIENAGFDHHSKLTENLDLKFIELNEALKSFVDELKSQGKWDDVTIIASSDFGRTLTPNSGKGSDHGWSGHSFVFGGQVDGGKILGEYPRDLTKDSELHVGRGRFIPTLPWEAMWTGVAEWMGIDDSDKLQQILPNINSFPGLLFEGSDLFTKLTNDNNEENKCDDGGEPVTCTPYEIPAAINDDDDDDDDDYYDSSSSQEDGANDLPRTTHTGAKLKSKLGAIIASTVVCSLLVIAVATAVRYNEKTGKISQWYDNVIRRPTNSTPARTHKHEHKYMHYIHNSEDEYSGSDNDNATQNMSFTSATSVTLLHLKNNDGVEIMQDEVTFK